MKLSGIKLPIIILVLVGLAVIGLSGWFFYVSNKSRDASSQRFFGEQGKLVRVDQKYGDLDFGKGQKFIDEALKRTSFSSSDFYLHYLLMMPDGNIVRYGSNIFKIDDREIQLETYQTVKGDKYKKTGDPIEYDLVVKDPKASLANAVDDIGQYFNLPGQLSTAKRDEFNVEGGGRAVEFVWKKWGYIESRGVWEAQDKTVHVLACRVFPESDLYGKDTCFSKSPN